MTLLFCDGFDHYDDNWEAVKWDYTADVAINITGGRRNGGYAYINDYGAMRKNITASETVIIGFAYGGNLGSGFYTNRLFVQLVSDNVVQVYFKTDAMTGNAHRANISAYNGDDTLLGQTTDYPLDMTKWCYLELKCTISDTVGVVQVKQNGTDILNLTSKDTKNDTETTIDEVRINGGANDFALDDLYIINTTGSYNNDFLGDIKVVPQFPTSDGTHTDFTPSTGTDHYALVDDPLVSTTDYNEGDTLNDIDSYGITADSNLGTIYGVQLVAAAHNPDVGTRKVKPILRSNSTDYLGTEITLSNTSQMAKDIWERDPADSAAWTKTKLDAIEIGLKVTL